MRVSGSTRHDPWRQAAGLLLIVPTLAIAGLAGPAAAAKPPTDESTTTTTTVAPADATTTTTPTQARLSTGKKINSAQDDPAGLDPGTDPPAAEQTKDGADPAAEGAASDGPSGEPGECGEKSCKHLTPIVECSFKDPGTGLFNTVWSYRGGGSRDTIPIGWYNYFTPGKIDQGQPTYFEPGMHKNVFITTHSGSLTWVLGLDKATAPGKDCGHNPVPITGAGLSSIVTLFAVGGLLGVVLVVRNRRRRTVKA